VTLTGSFDKVLLIGLDSAVPGRWRRYAQAGDLPAGQRLLERGAFATACLPAFPTLTTTNWATIATGAWPGTHGVTDFNPHRPGDWINASPQAFDARDVRAEFVWEAAVRAGLDSVVVNWPGAWPPRTWPPEPGPPVTGAIAGDGAGELTLVGGAGIELNEWRIGLPHMDRRVALAAEQRFSTLPEPGATRVVLPDAGVLLRLPLTFGEAYSEVLTAVELVARVVRRESGPALVVSDASGRQLAGLEPGEWSSTLTLKLRVKDEPVDGLLRLKLQDLDPEAGLLRLYVTDICRRSWLEQPAGVLETSGFAGLPTPGVGWDSLGSGGIDLDTFVELTAMATSWLGDVSMSLLESRPCELFGVHLHAVDSFYHLCARRLDPRANTAEEVRRYEAAECAIYRQLDDVVGRLVEVAGPRALVLLVSDHGAKPGGARVPLREILSRSGLLADGEGAAGGSGPIDWSRTLAAPQGSCYVRVNVSGREPGGIVAPADRERVRDDVMRAMLEYRDEASGLCPFTLVVTGEDAAELGLYGDGVGDVVYAVDQEFAEEHGQALPQDVREQGSWGMRCLCLLSGDGVSAGSTIDETVSLTDVAPTVCDALGIDPPAQAEGRSLLPLALGAELPAV
jgi:predicted AlkP superfamily phosphohydrolase/phosphomutase